MLKSMSALLLHVEEYVSTVVTWLALLLHVGRVCQHCHYISCINQLKLL
jgi:hypothetical protein